MGVKKLARKERSNEGGRRPPEKNTQVKINRRHINDSNRPALSSEFCFVQPGKTKVAEGRLRKENKVYLNFE